AHSQPTEIVVVSECVPEPPASESLLPAAEDMLHFGCWEWDVTNDTILWSDNMWRVFGHEPNAFPLRFDSYINLLPPDERDKVQQIVAAAVASGDRFEVQHSLVWPDGAKRHILGRGRVLRDRQGNLLKLIGCAADITELHNATERLVQSEALLNETEKILRYGSWTWNAADNTVLWSEGMWELFGYDPQENLSRVLDTGFYMSHVHPDDVAHVTEQSQQFISTGTHASSYEHRLICADGTIKVVDGKTKILEWRDGKPYRMVGATLDMTDERQATERIRQSEALLAETEKILNYGSWSWNVPECTVFVSDGFWRILGYEPDTDVLPEMTPAAYPRYIHPDDLHAFLASERMFCETGRPDSHEHRIIARDGQVKNVLLQRKTLVSQNGKPVKVVGSTVDITERKAAILALERMENLLTETERMLGHGSYRRNVKTNEIMWSKGLYYLHELPEGQKITFDEYFSRHVVAEDRPRMLANIRTAMEQKIPYTQEYGLLTSSNRRKHVMNRSQPVLDADGNLAEVIGSVTDVTELRRYQYELDEKMRELNRSNTELEQFAYTASHDLQEPLRKIRAFAEMLQQRLQGRLEEMESSALERMRSSAQRMQEMIQTLLEFSRIGRIQEPPVPVSLAETVRQVLDDLAEPIREKDAAISVSALPTVVAEPTQMHQLFQNLLSNALKFSTEKPVIRVFAEPIESADAAGTPHRFWQVSVSDNGIGFEPEYAEQVFAIFRRLNGRHEYVGTGIGLAICKKIVETHGGTIRAASQPGQGATFTFTLPA
ncbi:MAG: PAS domain-containing protein, partial [Cytophagales bacterium]|nr:PAS domain-containing protein [Cytophagales bacterium]